MRKLRAVDRADEKGRKKKGATLKIRNLKEEEEKLHAKKKDKRERRVGQNLSKYTLVLSTSLLTTPFNEFSTAVQRARGSSQIESPLQGNSLSPLPLLLFSPPDGDKLDCSLNSSSDRVLLNLILIFLLVSFIATAGSIAGTLNSPVRGCLSMAHLHALALALLQATVM
jgi:hypothetical protein